MEWAKANRAKLNARRQHRYDNEPNYKIAACLRARLTIAFKKAKLGKNWRTMELTGCTLEELVAHLSAQFTEGMTLANYGQWEIDHRIPLSTFDLHCPLQRLLAFHFTNLQPLWMPANRRKRTFLAETCKCCPVSNSPQLANPLTLPRTATTATRLPIR